MTACFVATVLACEGGRLARPCGRSAIFRLASGRSPAQLAALSQVPLGCGDESDRAWHPGRVRRHGSAFLRTRRLAPARPSPPPGGIASIRVAWRRRPGSASLPCSRLGALPSNRSRRPRSTSLLVLEAASPTDTKDCLSFSQPCHL